MLWRSLGGYKSLLLLRGAAGLLDQTRTFPPHDHVGQPVAPLLPRCPAPWGERLEKLVREQQLWPWGQAVYTPLPSFFQLHGFSGAAVCRTEIVRGMALALGMECPMLAAATADWDTDLEEKAMRALSLLADYPFVLVHVNGADECAHRKDPEGKTAFLSRVERQLLAPLAARASSSLWVTVTADHGTSSVTGRHTPQPSGCFRFCPPEFRENRELIPPLSHL